MKTIINLIQSILRARQALETQKEVDSARGYDHLYDGFSLEDYLNGR